MVKKLDPVAGPPPRPIGLPLWAAWSRLLLVPPSKYLCLVCGLVALQSARIVACALSPLLRAHCGIKGICPVWGCTTLSTTLRRFSVALHCHTEVYIFWCSRTPRGRLVKHISSLPGSGVPSSSCLMLPPGFSTSCPLCWVVPVLVFRPAPAALPALLPCYFVFLMPLVLCAPGCSPFLFVCWGWGTEAFVTPSLPCPLGATALPAEFVLFCLFLAPPWHFSPSLSRFLPPPLPLGVLLFCLSVCCLVGLCLSVLVWGGRTLNRAMDWTALQRALLALPSWALCFSVQSAREQQSLQTWFVWCGCAAVILLMITRWVSGLWPGWYCCHLGAFSMHCKLRKDDDAL